MRSLERYQAVVVGSAVYAGHWRGEAMRLLRRHRDWLSRHDVWLFSSGPVGEDVESGDEAERWTKPAKVQQLAAEIDAHDHVVFGGRVDDDRGFIRKKMARGMPEGTRDRRDWDEITTWAAGIASTLSSDASSAPG